MKNLIKKISLAIGIGLLFLSSLSPAFASVNKQINYQGKLTRPSDGQPVADGSYNVIFRIYDAASGGNCLWSARGDCGSPTAKSVTTSGGVFTTILGEAGDSAMDLDFTSGSYYLGVQIGVDAEMTPRRVLTSVPQAINANSVNGDGFINLSGTALGSGICQGLLCLNPASSNATDTLLGIQNGSNPLFKVEADGKVGIGTNAPNKSLHIKTATGTNAEMDIQSGSNNYWAMYQDDTAGSLRFWNDGISTEKNALTLLNNGNVGIGTTNPNAPLSISGPTGSFTPAMHIQTGKALYTNASSTRFGALYLDASNGMGMIIQNKDAYKAFVGQSTLSSLAYTSKVDADRYFVVNETNYTNGMPNIDSTFTIGSNTYTVKGFLSSGASSRIYVNEDISGESTTGTISNLKYSLERMKIDSNGNVGFGTTTGTLSSKVSILRTVPASVSVANSSLYLRGSDNGYGLAMGTLSDGSTWLQGMVNDAASVPINLNPSGGAINIGGGTVNMNNGTSNMILYNTSGVAAPSFTTRSAGTKIVLYPNISGTLTDFALGIEGSTMWSSVPGAGNSFKWYAGTTQVMLLDSSGNLTANSFIYSSDQRLKTDIKPLADNTLEKVKQIQPVSFSWKNGGDKEIGFIAQDVEQYYPELVTTDPNTGMKGMEYGNMTAVLLKAIQEQQEQIDQLKQEVETLKNK